MNYKKLAVVAFVGALAVFSFYHLTTAGSDFEILTTSDSGFFYGVGRDINANDGLINEYELSHPPQGKEIAKYNQFQPLMLVTLYRGVNAVDPSVSLMDVTKYFSPFLFSIALIGAFLAARELGGDLAGCASALFFATLTGSIYWSKIGAFDREITLLFFGTWLFYIITKVFKSEGMEFLKYSILAGILYGMFIITWTGSLFLAAIIGFAIVLIVLERAVSGMGLVMFAVIGLLPLGYKLGGFNGGIADLLGAFLLIGGLIKLATDYDALEKVEGNLISSIRNNIRSISGILVLIGVSTIIAISLGGYGPNIWTSLFTNRIPQFLGIGGGGGVSFPTYASEAQAASGEIEPFLSTMNARLYNNNLLTGLILAFTTIGIIRAVWSSKKEYLLGFSWLLLVFPMPLAQSRFFRLFWSLIPILAGFGLSVLFWASRDAILSPFTSASSWIDKLRNPIVLVIIGMVLVIPFVSNARDQATAGDPSPHGATLSSVYLSLMDSYEYLKDQRQVENVSPENFVVAVEWSHGHLLTGYADVASVTDGGQTVGWAKDWREQSRILPPDYLKYIRDQNGHIYGLDTPARPYTIDGRRIDIESSVGTSSMYNATEENELRWLLETYRDNLNLEIDYLVFNESPTRVLDLGWNSRTVRALFTDFTYNISEAPRAQLENRQGENYRFSFDNETITVRLQSSGQSLNILGAHDENGENLRGVMIAVQASGRYQYVTHKYFSKGNRENLIFLTYTRQGQSYNISRAYLYEFGGPPMIYRSYHEDTYEMPDFLEEVHQSSTPGRVGNFTAKVSVYKINHDKI